MAGNHNAPSFLERTRAAEKILVVDFGFLGDSVHLIPALWEIKRNYSGAELHTLSATVGAEVLALAPCVDRAWAFPLTAKSPPFWKHWGILWALRRERFDVAFNFAGTDRSIFATAFVGAPWTLGYEAGRRHFWNDWIISDWVRRGSREIPVFEQRRQVLAARGFELHPARYDLSIPAEAAQWAQSVVPADSAHISISASTPLKEWPLEHWSEMATRLITSNGNLHIVATASGNPREQARLDVLSKVVNSPRLICLSKPTIAQLSAILRRCQLQIGGDSGVLHLAVALGLPTLGILRDGAGLQEWMPQGESHRNFVAGCRCTAGKSSECSTRASAACLATITAKQVADEALRMLSA